MFRPFAGKDNEHYFRLINEEEKVFLTDEGYKQQTNLLNGDESVKKNITSPDK